MRKLAVFILVSIFVMLPVISLAISGSGDNNKTENEVLGSDLSCFDCHSNARIYPKHLDGYSYCEECHGLDIHPIHTFDCKTCHQNEPLTPFCHGADPDVVVPVSDGIICKACHENNLVVVHEEDCQSCHQDINEIHRKADIVGGVDDV